MFGGGGGWSLNNVVQETTQGRSRVNNLYAPKDLTKSFLGWGDEQIEEIRSIGLGGLLEIDFIPTTNRDYCQWIYQRIDTVNSYLRVGKTEAVCMDEIAVSRILGTRFRGSRKMNRDDSRPSEQHLRQARRLLGMLDANDEVTVSDLLVVLNKGCSEPITDEERVRTKVGFVMLCCAVFFSARGSHGSVACEAYEAVVDHEHFNEINWGRYVLDEIMDCARSVQYAVRTNKARFSISGCMLFLQVSTLTG
jgi:hypothetical protein